MVQAIVFFPGRDRAYAIAPDGRSYVYENFLHEGVTKGKVLSLPRNPQKVVYKHPRLSQEIIDRLQHKGFTVHDDIETKVGLPDAVLKMLTGETCGYIETGCMIRDLMVGAIIGNADGGFVCDASGNDLLWMRAGRQPYAVFGNSHNKAFAEVCEV